jgi:hypothetical protein
MDNIRVKLVNAVWDHSSEELETLDLLKIAKSSNEELIDRLINILEWYANEHNNK